MDSSCILWFRKDLRLDDNLALIAASKHRKIIPIFIFDDSLDEYKNIGEASRWWLESSLISLNLDLKDKLSVLEGKSIEVLSTICKENKIEHIYWNRCYEPDRIIADKAIKNKFLGKQIGVKSFNSSLLWEPWNIKNNSGSFYKVFTPFYKKGCLNSEKPRLPEKKPKTLSFSKLITSNKISFFRFQINKSKWHLKFRKIWNTSEAAARKNFNDFLENGASDYHVGRNFPSKKSVSRISPYLHWGQISPFRVWFEANSKMSKDHKNTFLSEIGWREFSYNLLYHYPKINQVNLKKNFDKLKWQYDRVALVKWQKGETGYPIVDAGMRELWKTGYMHNRLRMITASFLVKNLLIHWKHGERWFWNCLVDADLANNSASWQWIAGTGADAAPFFRIFNPITQGQKFDKEAKYIREYVPELSKLSNKIIFTPWLADQETLKNANLKLGIDYPFPIIDYTFSRQRALQAFKELKDY